jgi:hypothetical protein
MSEKTTKISQNLLNHFQELYNDENLCYVENDLKTSAENIATYFEILYSIAMDLETGKLNKVEIKDNEEYSKYNPVYCGVGNDILRTFEFINQMTKEEISKTKQIINAFFQHKDFTNQQYSKIHSNMVDSHRRSLMLDHFSSQKAKSAIEFSSLSSSIIEEESKTMSYREYIVAEFIDSSFVDEYGLPYYP